MTNWSARLREDLCARAAAYATQAGVASYKSGGSPPTTLFPLAPGGRSHGNFEPQSFAALAANASWRQRLEKPHTRQRGLKPPYDATACELDSCTSSDALLMNVFCYPGAVAGSLATLLGVRGGTTPEFGVAGDVPLRGGRTDATEIDMRLGETNVEAKLTEADFTRRAKPVVDRYDGLNDVFETALLPADGDDYLGYQLIRNVLAVARRPAARFLVLLDARRPDLLREWWTVHTAIKDGGVRARCGFATWQEVAAEVPAPLRAFLSLKYGL